ncbi:Sigma-B regulation protein RsbU (Phosphoserine phosphatase) (modular protein) [Burkholderiales bacterium 8X]|nr:Sigma-B regulation protein RsbU (Phosphoserine phosphatase) (modular protein) [Burkholderiales bacterium 8X]
MSEPDNTGSGMSAPAWSESEACGLLVTAPDGLIREVNRTFCDWIGSTRDELVGRSTLQSLLTMGGRIFYQTHLAPLLLVQRSVSEVKLEVLHRDGRRIPMILNAVRRVRDGVAALDVAAFIAEDRHKYEQELMLARRKAEAALIKEQEAQRELLATQAELTRLRAVAEDRALFAEQMMAVVSHDLRNPLSVIDLSANLIGRYGGLSERQARSLDKIRTSTERAIRLIADLLDFSQAREGRGLRVELADNDVEAVVAECVEELRVAYPDAVLLHEAVGTGTSRSSADKLAQLIGNLVSNAVTYGFPGRPIVIRSEVQADRVMLSVCNEGNAIPAHQLPTLFEPMTRGDEGESPVHSLGLGLYIVREIAKAHGGDVTVDSAGNRTVFTVTLPRHDIAPDAASTGDAESLRQQELDRLQVSSLQDAAYDEIVRMAADAFDVPIALISLVDGDRQWFKARVGLKAAETPREHAFCAHAIRAPSSPMQVEDARSDQRFAANPFVTGDPNIRFYAGAPLVTSNGHALGTLCVIDDKPRALDAKQLETLQYMAQQVITMMEQRAQGLPRKQVLGSSGNPP